MRLLAIFALIAICLVGCKDEDEDGFKGITETDENNRTLGPFDNSDWNFGSSTTKVRSLFYGIAGINYNCTKLPDSILNIQTAYPNPTQKQFIFPLTNPLKYPLDLRLVNNKYQTLVKIDSVTSDAVALDVSTLPQNKIYRLYYRVLVDSCAFIGYGDVEVK